MTRKSLTLLGVCLFFFIASINATTNNFQMTSSSNFTLEVDYDSSSKGVPTYRFSANDSSINTLQMTSMFERNGQGTAPNSTVDLSSIVFKYPSSGNPAVGAPFNISSGVYANNGTTHNSFNSLIFSNEVYKDQSYAHLEIILTNYTWAQNDAQLVFGFKFQGRNDSTLNESVITNGPAFFTIGDNNVANFSVELGEDNEVIIAIDHFTNETLVHLLYFGIGNGTVDGAGVAQPKKGLKAGYIVLIVAVVLIVVSAAVAAAVIFIRKRKRYEYV